MGNARGNRYSRNHTTLNPDEDSAFWRFSWHEIGYFDLRAMIDYVLEKTTFKRTGYFGHSQGTTSFWVLCSMYPEYNEKITMMHALAPVAFMKHIKAPLLSYARNMVKISTDRINEFMPRTDILWKSCLSSKLTEGTCVEVMFQIVGKNIEETNMVNLIK